MQNLPEKHQTLLFSATMPVEIEALAQVRSFCDWTSSVKIYELFVNITILFLWEDSNCRTSKTPRGLVCLFPIDITFLRCFR